MINKREEKMLNAKVCFYPYNYDFGPFRIIKSQKLERNTIIRSWISLYTYSFIYVFQRKKKKYCPTTVSNIYIYIYIYKRDICFSLISLKVEDFSVLLFSKNHKIQGV
jgi:hypothetical protein